MDPQIAPNIASDRAQMEKARLERSLKRNFESDGPSTRPASAEPYTAATQRQLKQA